jgi:hypothetical protein
MGQKSSFKMLPMIFTFFLMVFVFTTFLVIITMPMLDKADTMGTGTNLTIAVSALFAMMFISFIRVASTDAGEIPEWFNDSMSYGQNASLTVKNVEKKSDGSRRYCNKCQMFKPDRTHHCKICGRCNLKMDHHCPWVNNCIGYRNHKFFILFIVYALACCIFVFVVTLTTIPAFNANTPFAENFVIVLDCVISGALSIALTAFVGFHFFLLSNNYTTIEFLEKRGFSPSKTHVNFFNLGAYENFKRSMGSNPILWLLPIGGISENDQGQGTRFDTNERFSV